LNSDGGEKLREDEWLISAILREINQLERVAIPCCDDLVPHTRLTR
jgi:hypothetical protein